ncbi:MAG TPA: hypothetical protein VFP46_02005 [Candidatus Paceibacterota bacterium]|nr:hypothetical protein [Candidatus Paceibacterota bacterium]
MHARQFRNGLLLGFLALVSFWLLSLIWGIAGKARVAVTQATEAKTEYEELEARKATLQANLAALDTPRGTDAAIRTAFGVARPGEEVIVVVPPATASPTSTPTWWDRLIDWFK